LAAGGRSVGQGHGAKHGTAGHVDGDGQGALLEGGLLGGGRAHKWIRCDLSAVVRVFDACALLRRLGRKQVIAVIAGKVFGDIATSNMSGGAGADFPVTRL